MSCVGKVLEGMGGDGAKSRESKQVDEGKGVQRGKTCRWEEDLKGTGG